MARRGMTLCASCGHASALHRNGSCSICGCGGGLTYVGTPTAIPGRGRGEREREREASAPKRTWSPPADDLTPYQQALLDFIVNHMTVDQVRRWGIGVARRLALQFAP